MSSLGELFLSKTLLAPTVLTIGKKVRRFQLCHQLLAMFILCQDVIMSQMSLYIELDRRFTIAIINILYKNIKMC